MRYKLQYVAFIWGLYLIILINNLYAWCFSVSSWAKLGHLNRMGVWRVWSTSFNKPHAMHPSNGIYWKGLNQNSAWNSHFFVRWWQHISSSSGSSFMGVGTTFKSFFITVEANSRKIWASGDKGERSTTALPFGSHAWITRIWGTIGQTCRPIFGQIQEKTYRPSSYSSNEQNLIPSNRSTSESS